MVKDQMKKPSAVVFEKSIVRYSMIATFKEKSSMKLRRPTGKYRTQL